MKSYRIVSGRFWRAGPDGSKVRYGPGEIISLSDDSAAAFGPKVELVEDEAPATPFHAKLQDVVDGSSVRELKAIIELADDTDDVEEILSAEKANRQRVSVYRLCEKRIRYLGNLE